MAVDRLSPEDARILGHEVGNVCGHTVKVLVLEAAPGAAPPGVDALRDHVAARLHLVPRLRRRVAPTPMHVAAPVWVDDAAFDLARHIRAAPGPAELEPDALPELVAALMHERLDRGHPLWRIDVVERVGERGSALIWRLHHALADGIAAMRIAAAVLWDVDPAPPARPAPPAWEPQPAPGALRLMALGLADRARAGTRRLSVASHGVPSVRQWRTDLPRMEDVVRREFAPGPGEPVLDRPAGLTRSVAFASAELAALKRIGHALGPGATVNDVVLAAVAGALREWLDRHAGAGGRLRVKVPVSLREHRGQPDALGNRDSYFFVALPVEEPDPVARLRAISEQTADRKRRGDAEVLYHLPLHGVLDRWGMSPRVFTFNVSNVPGPRAPVYVAGARLRTLYSLAEIADHHALRIAAVSAAGTLSFGISADHDAVGDVDLIARGIERAVAELAECA